MIETWSKGEADANMPQELLVDLYEKVNRHPWWAARARLARRLLDVHGVQPPASVVDVGCGWGTNLVALEQAARSVSDTLAHSPRHWPARRIGPALRTCRPALIPREDLLGPPRRFCLQAVDSRSSQKHDTHLQD